MPYTKLAIIAGNCLFPSHESLNADDSTLFFMAEDKGLCTHYRYHKHKLILFLSAMRQHAQQIGENHRIEYRQLDGDNAELSYEDKLDRLLAQYTAIETVVCYELEDHFFAERISKWCRHNRLTLEWVDSPGFLTTRREFKEYLAEVKAPFMATFYKRQRRRLGLLMDENGDPLHGQWSFDKENRKPLPSDIEIPELPSPQRNAHDEAVIELVDQLFADHPGSSDNFHWSTSRRSALHQLDRFLKERFENFGPYEDAIHKKESFLFHSVLSPYINIGLITPDEVVDRCLEYYREKDVHFPSVEGFVRQLAGWREFMRGIYHNFDLQKNHFHNRRRMKDCWYEGTTGIPPLDDSIRKVKRHGYAHHIDRLMIQGNLMLTCGLHPDEVYRWFMEMYVDSSDWVMVPNVYGMSQFADGGIFATKPYISGSNYLLKMSNYSKGPWCDIVDGLYWRFIDRKKNTFKGNPRMAMMLSTLDRMNPEKREYLFKKADQWIEEVSEAGD